MKKTIGILALALALALAPMVSAEKIGGSPGVFMRESSYTHIRALVNPNLVFDNIRANAYAEANGLPHWAPYKGQCSIGLLAVNSRGVLICYRPGGGQRIA